MEANLFSGSSWLGLLGSVGLLVATHVTKKYLIPFLQVGKREQYARYIAVIAEDIIDDLRRQYPEKEWLKHLDEAVERLIAICEISQDVAQRAINASASRK